MVLVKMKLKAIMACGRDVYFDYQLIDALTGKTLVDRVCDKTNIKSGDEEWIAIVNMSLTKTGKSANGDL